MGAEDGIRGALELARGAGDGVPLQLGVTCRRVRHPARGTTTASRSPRVCDPGGPRTHPRASGPPPQGPPSHAHGTPGLDPTGCTHPCPVVLPPTLHPWPSVCKTPGTSASSQDRRPLGGRACLPLHPHPPARAPGCSATGPQTFPEKPVGALPETPPLGRGPRGTGLRPLGLGNIAPRGPWGAQSVERPTWAQLMISRFAGSSLARGSVLTARSLELLGIRCLPLSLPLPHLRARALSRSPSQDATHLCPGPEHSPPPPGRTAPPPDRSLPSPRPRAWQSATCFPFLRMCSFWMFRRNGTTPTTGVGGGLCVLISHGMVRAQPPAGMRVTRAALCTAPGLACFSRVPRAPSVLTGSPL